MTHRRDAEPLEELLEEVLLLLEEVLLLLEEVLLSPLVDFGACVQCGHDWIGKCQVFLGIASRWRLYY